MSNPRQHGPAGELPPGFHPSQYWDPLLHERQGMALYGRYVKPGDLVFDIGANVGQRTGWFLRLGCRVIAVEPQAELHEFIPHGQVEVVSAAVGSVEGEQVFHVCSSSNYLSTLSDAYVDQVYAQPGIGGNIYTDRRVQVTTLDALIGRFGVPAFAKIDVEGGELGVLQGLSHPLAALSFECHSFDPGKTLLVLAELDRLGDYDLSYSPLETFELGPFPPREYAIFGDIYAVLQ